jgi:copper chaperone
MRAWRKEFMDKTNIENVPQEERLLLTAYLGIAGMTCDECVKKVEQALRELTGIKEVSVDRERAIAKVTFDSSAINVPAMHDALLRSGYKPAAAPQR